MKLKAACEIAEACGLETVGEAIRNIEIHAISLFTYDELDKEMNELYDEAAYYMKEVSIFEVLKKCIMPECPYCPACKYGRVIYPEWVETYEDTEGCECEWICTLTGELVK